MTLLDTIRQQADITITIHPEDTHPRDSFEDAQDISSILESLEHNLWAWCVVQVTARWKGLTATDYLGGCSYENEREFRRCGYYSDMKHNCIADLVQQATAIRAA
jgi:hypothetical protein